MRRTTCFFIFITAAGVLCCARLSDAYGELKSGLPARHVVFSELTLSPAPGLIGSWIELYNRSPESTDLSGSRIVFNGKLLVTFPDGCGLPPRALLLVSFKKADSPKWHENPTRANVVVVVLRGTNRFESKTSARAAGYCALEQSNDQAEPRVLDYVRWGRKRLADDKIYFQRASRIGAWHPYRSDPIYVGLAPEPGDPPIPRDPAVLSRQSFSAATDNVPLWIVLPMSSATPGAGNTNLPPPIILSPLDGSTRHREDGLVVGFRGEVTPSEKGSGYRLQLAADPHFEHVISDVSLQQTYHTFKADILPPGPYFLRVKWRSNVSATPWSQTVCVFLK